MIPKPGRTPTGWSGLLLSQLLALVFLAGCLWRVWLELKYVMPRQLLAGSSQGGVMFAPVLWRQLAAYLAALLLSHLLLGFASYALARLSHSALAGGTPARLRWLVIAWFVALAGIVLAANTTWFVSSQFAGAESWWRQTLAGHYPVQIVGAALAIVILAMLVRAALPMRRALPSRRAAVFGVALIAAVAAAALVRVIGGPSARAGVTPTPHVVLIGIDSLRDDLMIPRGGEVQAPRLREFLASAHRFTDTTSPLARTYPSWLSVLTGRHPVSTNARFNLMPRRVVREGETLAEALSGRGYHATYATDEARFANFDESFGFDRLITPPVGAIDFLLGYGADMPLVNLVASTPAGRWLFPSNHANRAAYVTYEPGHFVARLRREIEITGPSLLVIHLTLPHWPYAWAGERLPRQPQQYRNAYAKAVAAADRQFGEVMALLAEKRVLDNAVVVLLSDHGEALGADGDSMIRKTGTSQEIWNTLWGHGTSVLSPHQFAVVLAMRAFGAAKLPGSPGRRDWPVSLEDVRPTIEQLITSSIPRDLDGVSLLQYLSDPAQAAGLAKRVRFTETDFNTISTVAGRYEASGIVSEASTFYELDPVTGWVQLKAHRVHELIARKQRAAISSDALLAMIPGHGAEPSQFLLTSRKDPLPRRLEGPPDPARDPEAARLWDALRSRFPGEVP